MYLPAIILQIRLSFLISICIDSNNVVLIPDLHTNRLCTRIWGLAGFNNILLNCNIDI